MPRQPIFQSLLPPPVAIWPARRPVEKSASTLEWSLLLSGPAAIWLHIALVSTRNHEIFRMSQLLVHVGDFTFQARFEEQLAPKTCAAFRKAMPFESQAIHVRWSGEGVWMPLGDLDFGVGYENHTSYPAPGHIILYPGGISETEILLAYSGVHFASKMGQLAGNHFITLTSNLESLPEMGKTVLWKGAQKVRFEDA
jgi:hypothetical protein